MGFFDALFGGNNKRQANIDVFEDKIWLTEDAKFAGLAKEVAARVKTETVAILLVAHFPDVLAKLAVLDAAQAVQTPNEPVMAVLAADLSVDIATRLNLGESETIDIIVAERHPMRSVDDRLEQFAGELPCRCRFSHHLSLEDPTLEAFASEWVLNMLEQLGMTEDEAIESKMVARRIKQAQLKIEAKVQNADASAESAAEWLEKNCPDFQSG